MKRSNSLESLSSSHLWRPRRGETALEKGRLLSHGVRSDSHWTEEQIETLALLLVPKPVLRSVVDDLRRGVDHVVRPGSRTSSAEDRLAGG